MDIAVDDGCDGSRSSKGNMDITTANNHVQNKHGKSMKKTTLMFNEEKKEKKKKKQKWRHSQAFSQSKQWGKKLENAMMKAHNEAIQKEIKKQKLGKVGW